MEGKNTMNVCIVGTGYVGLVAGTCFAESGNDVICVDIDEEKVNMLSRGEIPIYEPGLKELVLRNMEEERLSFTTDLDQAVKKSLFCFIAVGTPPDQDGSADLQAVVNVAKDIARAMDGYKIIVDKSTVPVGTAELVRETVAKITSHEFDVVSNPEFLKEGAALDDFLKPDRVVIGTDNVRTGELMKELYGPFVRTGNPLLIIDIKSAEMTKYAANAFLATRVSFMNEVANLCELVGADVSQVRQGMGSDSRIGYQFLFPGVGYGGSCFPKDVKALIATAKSENMDFQILQSVEKVNEEQKQLLVRKIDDYFKGDLKGKKIAIWGLSFKPRTDDTREAPSLVIIPALLDKGAELHVYDPEAMEIVKGIFGDKLTYHRTYYEAVQGVDALALVTEWSEFRRPNFERLKSAMKSPVIFDGRNVYDPKTMKNNGFIYYSIGRPLK